MNYYEITLWVTLEQETAIYELFKARRWMYSRWDSHVSFLYQKERNANPCIPQVDYLAEETESGYQEHVEINLGAADVETFCRDRQGNGSNRFLDTRNLSEQSDGFRQRNIHEEPFCINEQNVGDKLAEKTIYSGTEIESSSATAQRDVYYGHGQEMVHDKTAGKTRHTVSENQSRNATLQTDVFCAGGQQNSEKGVVNSAEASLENVACSLAGHIPTHGIESNSAVHVKEDRQNSDFENSTTAASQNYIPCTLQPVDIQEISTELVQPPSTVGQGKFNLTDVDVNKRTSKELSLPDHLTRSTAITTPDDAKPKEKEADIKSHQENLTKLVEAAGLADFPKHLEKHLCNEELNKARQEVKLVASRMSLRSKQTPMEKHVMKQGKNEHPGMGYTDSSDLANDNKNGRSSTNSREVSNVVECKEKEQFKKKYKDKIRLRKSQQKKKSGNKSLARKTRNKRIEEKSVADGDEIKTEKNKKVNIYCKDCEHVFKYQKNYDKHLAEGKCRHVCEYCGKVFLNGLTGNYKIHVKYHLKLKNHECHICGKKYIEYRKLKEHYRKHSGEKPYMCDECGQTFSGFGSLYAHKKNKHVGIRETFSCSQCPKVFKGYSGLLFHVKYYHTSPSEKPYSCAKCEKTFKTPDILKRHETVHRETKDFKCDQCDAAFKRIQGLTEHKKRHTKEYTYFCSHCGKGFYTRQATVVHERVHTGEKPYCCSICNYTCSLNGNLKKHMKTHERHF